MGTPVRRLHGYGVADPIPYCDLSIDSGNCVCDGFDFFLGSHHQRKQRVSTGGRDGSVRRSGTNLSATKSSLGNRDANARQYVLDMWSRAGRRKPCTCYRSLPHRGWHICPRNSRLDPHIDSQSLLQPVSRAAFRCL